MSDTTSVAEALWSELEALGISQVFSVSGGMIAPLLDALGKTEMNVTFMHHEQSCAMAADSYYRIAGRPAAVLVTNGPGASNALTGVLGAFQDSIPLVVVSGQAPTHQSLERAQLPLRQLGVQEADTRALAMGVTKSFESVKTPEELSDVVRRSFANAVTSRSGPVWIEIPIDVQNQPFVRPPATFAGTSSINSILDTLDVSRVAEMLGEAKRPLMLVGHGVRLARAESELSKFLSVSKLPVIATWNGADLFSFTDDQFIGNIGILGERAANWAAQNCDFLLVIGSRMSIPIIGYDTQNFAPLALKVMVDIDSAELGKPTLSFEKQICSDAREFLQELNRHEIPKVRDWGLWLRELVDRKSAIPLEDEELVREAGSFDAYEIVAALGRVLSGDYTLVTDMGSAFTCTMQAFRRKTPGRVFTSSGTSSMGFGVPGAIGAYFADPSRQTIAIVGDGGLQMTIQELQTIFHLKIPIKILVLNSKGYLAVSLTQDSLFSGRRMGSDPASGISSPNFFAIAQAYGLAAARLDPSRGALDSQIDSALSLPGPTLIEVFLPKKQLMRPKVMSFRNDSGQMQSPTLDKMWPEHPDLV